ncbi:hypothetical protein H1D32_13270 [Anaerobacillus sp. CMMVII]|uniref:hypothetical protein n=1 Tax=Anaerobacillus sp. CMMVII TaxID=2755588 RepID=UPI0021B7F7A6|nr:hypothetical protein [Anaerobacillus sp. CMMVII]MCT8138626.1 hypothetical protein [Anaerobacillus sp. CMMVII]
MIIEELSLFDFSPAFNPEKANWKKGVDNHKYCEVLAIIPDDALCPLEQGYSGSGNPLKEYRHKLWGDHAIAIWNYLGIDGKWGTATDLLSKHRKAKEPIKMRISERDIKCFEVTQIVEYLGG